jgi:hypothetical protein
LHRKILGFYTQNASSWVVFTGGGWLGKCPNVCPFCTLNPAIHCPLSQLTLSWFKWKVML